MKEPERKSASPQWSATTKAIISLLILAAAVTLIIRFSSLMSTLVTAIVIAILLYPLAEWINRQLKISWGWAVTIVYLITLIITFGLLTLGGIAIVNQIQSFILFLQDSLGAIASFFDRLTTTVVTIGPFVLDFTYINWTDISNQLLSTLEPFLSNLGNFLGGIASGTAGFIGSLFLALVISFLLLNESGGKRSNILAFNMPAYQEDYTILKTRINTIWNVFIRGQSIVYFLRFIMYLIILSIFRVRFVFGMALIATIGNFIPYLGVAISWITIFLVALLQGSTAYGLNPLPYALIVMGTGWITDNIYDTFFSPRFLANVLDVHPAAILVGVFVGLNLFGFWGMVLAAPTIATLKLLLNYVGKKLTDQDPWADSQTGESLEKKPPVFGRRFKAVYSWLKKQYRKIETRIKRNEL
ncbi:MAG: AI-2E family transporter [Anaerolineae bacterium]|nr:AI-2E family transporter [Anaerolineae bacterium]